jgi:hypothetical protein
MLASGFGAFLICAEACLHFETLLALPGSWLSLPFYDWAAGAFLIFAGVRSHRDWGSGHLYQVAAWAFSVSLLFGAFFGFLAESPAEAPAENLISDLALTIIVGFLFALSLCGLASTMAVSSGGQDVRK